jgi:hypothetical protein
MVIVRRAGLASGWEAEADTARGGSGTGVDDIGHHVRHQKGCLLADRLLRFLLRRVEHLALRGLHAPHEHWRLNHPAVGKRRVSGGHG